MLFTLGLCGRDRRIRKAFEPIFEKNNVDMYLSGHVHAFERSLPVLDNVPYFNHGDGAAGNGGDGGGDNAAGRSSPSAVGSSSKMVYEDPVAPVHIVNGAGGCLEVSPTAGACVAIAPDAAATTKGGLRERRRHVIAWCRSYS